MANLKQCQTCHKVKDTNQYSKCKSNKDGLQYCCKECNKKTNLKFRTEINPQHHKIWQDANWDTFMEYMRKYRKADKGGIIYAIVNPEGKQYIGMTEAHEFKVIKECPGLTRKQLLQMERSFITLNKFQNISLNTK
jgi:uncharacterized FlaG/YvyC family protein